MSRRIAVDDMDLEALTSMSGISRDAWIERRVADLRARGVTLDVSPEARLVLERNHNRFTWSGDLRG